MSLGTPPEASVPSSPGRKSRSRWALAGLVAAGLLVGGYRGYSDYVAAESPVIVVLAQTGGGMNVNDPGNHVRTLIDAVWNHPGRYAYIYLVAYGRTATVIARRHGAQVIRPLPPKLGTRPDVRYPDLHRALLLAQSLFREVPLSHERTVVILSDGFPYPGPHVGTHSIGLMRQQLAQQGVSLHAILFGLPGPVAWPNASDRSMERATWLEMQWTHLYRPPAPGDLTLSGLPSGTLQVGLNGTLSAAGSQVTTATQGRALVPITPWLGQRQMLVALAALYMALFALLVGLRLRRRLILRIRRDSDPASAGPVLVRHLVSGFTHPFQIAASLPDGPIAGYRVAREGHGPKVPGTSRQALVAVRQVGKRWLLTGLDGHHLYMGDGIPQREVVLEPGLTIRFAGYLLKVDSATKAGTKR